MHGQFQAIPFEGFPGLYTFGDPLDAPGSPDNLNVDFEPGSVFSRVGTALVVSLGSTIMSVKEFLALDSTTRRLLVLAANGNLGKLDETYSFSLISGHLGTAVRMKSATLFGREFMAFSSDGKIGTERPRTYDNINLDPLAASPPASPVAIVDSATAGSIAKGRHYARMFYQTRSGFWTAFGPEFYWDAAGGKKCNVSQVWLGPAYVVERIVAFSRSGDSRLFFLPGSAMEVKDPSVTTIADLDFTDEDLGRKGIEVDYLAQMVAAPPAAGVVAYSNRICIWGLRNAEVRHGDEGFLALDFNSGFLVQGPGQIPNGWTELTAGCTKSNPDGAVGDCLRLQGDGASQRARISNNYPAYKVLTTGRGYSVRVRALKKRAGMTGTFHVYVVPIGNPDFGTFSASFDASEFSDTAWSWIEKPMIDAASNVPGASWQLRISGGGPPGGGGTPISNGDYFDLDEIEIFQTNEKTLPSDVFLSLPDDPESMDFLNGRKSVAPNNGQAVRGAFELRGKLYFLKERSLYATGDNGSEPAQWPLEEVSPEVGSPSVDGYATADGWAIIAGETGPYFFNGGAPAPIGAEITRTWQRINWAKGETVWVKIDTLEKRIQIGVPLDGATAPSHVLICRYTGATPFDGGEGESPRKWGLWNIAANCAEVFHRNDGTRPFFYGRTTGMVKLDGSTRNDEGALISSHYRMPFIGGATGRKLFGAATLSAFGAGILQVSFFAPDNLAAVLVQPVSLRDPMDRDIEWQVIRAKAERMAPQFEMSQIGAYWRVRKMGLYAKAAPHTPNRGVRS